MANGFVEVSGYSATDLANARAAGYNECKEDLTTLTAEENGTYVAEDEGVVGWDRVEVEAQADLFHRLITANGDYDAEEDGHQGYSSVTVAVPGGGGGGPFTVRFINDNQILQEVTVPYGGRAEYNTAIGIPVSPVQGQTFVGWNPSPDYVTTDMNCYAKFKEKTISIGEITDGWDVICANKGEPYPLGSYKTLSYGAEITKQEVIDSFAPYTCITPNFGQLASNGVIGMTFDFRAVKVAEGEDGTVSTWIMAPIKVAGSPTDQPTSYWNLNGILDLRQGNGGANYTYMQYGGRGFLNGPFFDHFSPMFRQVIKPVTKWTQYSTRSSAPWNVQATEEKIWVPSVKEIYPTDVHWPIGGGKAKFVDAVVEGVSYFHDTLPLTAQQINSLLMLNIGAQFHLRDVPDTTDGPYGGWRTPALDYGNGNIYEAYGSGSGYNSYVCNAGITQYCALGFCMG